MHQCVVAKRDTAVSNVYQCLITNRIFNTQRPCKSCVLLIIRCHHWYRCQWTARYQLCYRGVRFQEHFVGISFWCSVPTKHRFHGGIHYEFRLLGEERGSSGVWDFNISATRFFGRGKDFSVSFPREESQIKWSLLLGWLCDGVASASDCCHFVVVEFRDGISCDACDSRLVPVYIRIFLNAKCGLRQLIYDQKMWQWKWLPKSGLCYGMVVLF